VVTKMNLFAKLSLTAASVGSTLGLLLPLPPAIAADFSFRGNFTRDDNVQLFNFTVGSSSTVTLRTLSYAGGTQADGTVVTNGGFDPILALFDSSGNFIDNNDDGDSSEVPADPITERFFDTYLQVVLGAGNYTVAVSQYDNFFSGGPGDNISLGFDRQGDGNFTPGTTNFPCSASRFCDVDGNSRTSFWAFDILNVQSGVVVPPTEPVPEPSTVVGSLILGLVSTKLAKKGKHRRLAAQAK
jgi:hypothetical protein